MEPPAPSEECSVNDTEPIISLSKKKLKVKVSSRKGTKNAISTEDESAEHTVVCQEREGFRQNDKKSDGNIRNDCYSKLPFSTDASLEDAMIPRVMCVGHDGKVAWDVKWKPKTSESGRGQRMGYLAVVLGIGSIEVWEIPSLRMTRAVFSPQHKNGIDPRFLKLKPVFRCSKLKCRDRQSMPLIMEWSASPPHDILLAGCHDGLVALWKFSLTGSSEESRPLLCFSADTVPIRTLAWAPFEGDPESSNVVVTAGHEGLKFWDLRIRKYIVFPRRLRIPRHDGSAQLSSLSPLFSRFQPSIRSNFSLSSSPLLKIPTFNSFEFQSLPPHLSSSSSKIKLRGVV